MISLIDKYIKLTNAPRTEVIDFLARYSTTGKRTEESLFCKCGDPKKYRNKITNTCGKKECWHMFGRKRPKHSKIMKILAKKGSSKYKASLMQKGQLKNKNVNTAEFKKKVLNKLSIPCNGNLNKAFGKYLRERNQSRPIRTKMILTKYRNWDSEFQLLADSLVNTKITSHYLSSLSDEIFSKLYKRLHGIQSLVNAENSLKTGRNNWFISETLINLKYNSDGKTIVRTRSGTESKYIRLFEQNRIMWNYEKYRINTIDNTGFYVPDFVIEYQGKVYVVEVKGTFYRQDKKTYLANKAMAGAKFAQKFGWRYCITFNQNPKNMKFLNNATFLLFEDGND